MLFISITFLSLCSYAQTEEDARQITESLLNTPDDGDNLNEHAEELEQDYADPLDLNTASSEELRQLFMLDERAIQSLISYRAVHGNLISIYELQAVPGFDADLIKKILPYVTIETKNEQRLPASATINHRHHTYLMLRYSRTLEKKQGFLSTQQPENRFAGNEGHVYIRFRSSRSGNYSTGFTLESDPGEGYAWDPKQRRYGFDYFSFHIQLQNRGIVKNVIVGDFNTQFGQGLVLGRNFGLGKGAETVTTVRRTDLGFLPYTSSGENGFHRGVAIAVSPVSHFLISAYGSSTRLDAYLSSDSLHGITSFIETGLHRNQNEIDRRRNVVRSEYGGVVQFQKSLTDIGVLFSDLQLSQPVIPTEKNYNQFAFQGSVNKTVGGYCNFNSGNVAFFSAAAKNLNGGAALVAGLTGSLVPTFDLTLHFRKYDRNFQSWSRSAFMEGSSPQNEEGFYLGWRDKLSDKVEWSGYVDLFAFPWLRYHVYAPSVGHEGFMRLTYKPGETSTIYMQVKQEQKAQNNETDSNLFELIKRRKRFYRIDFTCDANKSLDFHSRVEYSTLLSGTHLANGIALVQDLNYRVGKFRASLRYALFDTDDYEERLYVYERDTWLSFSLPAYYGRGLRDYVLIQYNAASWLTLWLRFSRTHYMDDTIIGTGLDEITGRMKNDFKLQVKITPR